MCLLNDSLVDVSKRMSWHYPNNRTCTWAICLLLGTGMTGCSDAPDGDHVGEPAPAPPASRTRPPHLTAAAALTMSLATGEVLFERASTERRAIASLTKIMTAVIAIEAVEDGVVALDDLVTVSENAARSSVGGASSGLTEGDQISFELLLLGMMLPSGNDAATAIAEHVSGDVSTFVDRMNDQATDLGLTDTHFVNPHGLDPVAETVMCETALLTDPSCAHYSTAHDVALLSAYAMDIPLLAEIAATQIVFADWLGIDGEMKNRTFCNANLFLRHPRCGPPIEYEGINGLKSGDTPLAGACLSTVATNSLGDALVVVVLGSANNDSLEGDRYSDTITLLNLGFDSLQR